MGSSNAGVNNADPYWKGRPLACRLGSHTEYRCDPRGIIVFHRCKRCPYSWRVSTGDDHSSHARWERGHQQ